MKITDALLAEHVVFHNMFDYVEKAVPTMGSLAEVRAISSLLERMLKIHSKAEDHLLFDPLDSAFAQLAQDDNFHHEHEEIEQELESIQAARGISEARRRLLSAVVMSRKHFDKEERIVFPLAEKQLSSKSLLLLGQRWEEQRSVPLA
jgi:hemerythrin-like domain-containing protein